jgi:hypothetical protein
MTPLFYGVIGTNYSAGGWGEAQPSPTWHANLGQSSELRQKACIRHYGQSPKDDPRWNSIGVATL